MKRKVQFYDSVFRPIHSVFVLDQRLSNDNALERAKFHARFMRFNNHPDGQAAFVGMTDQGFASSHMYAV